MIKVISYDAAGNKAESDEVRAYVTKEVSSWRRYLLPTTTVSLRPVFWR